MTLRVENANKRNHGQTAGGIVGDSGMECGSCHGVGNHSFPSTFSAGNVGTVLESGSVRTQRLVAPVLEEATFVHYMSW